MLCDNRIFVLTNRTTISLSSLSQFRTLLSSTCLMIRTTYNSVIRFGNLRHSFTYLSIRTLRRYTPSCWCVKELFITTIQDGGWPTFWKPLNGHISAMVRPIATTRIAPWSLLCQRIHHTVLRMKLLTLYTQNRLQFLFNCCKSHRFETANSKISSANCKHRSYLPDSYDRPLTDI